MKRSGWHHGLQNESRTTTRQRLHGENITTAENLRSSTAFTESHTPRLPGLPAMDGAEDARSHVDLFEDEEVTTAVKDVEDQAEQAVDECSVREKLQRHRRQMAGNVWIPETWEQEDRLKEWVDPKVLDQALASNGLMSARIALVEDCRRRDHPKRVAIDLKAVGDQSAGGVSSIGSVAGSHQVLQNSSHFFR